MAVFSSVVEQSAISSILPSGLFVCLFKKQSLINHFCIPLKVNLFETVPPAAEINAQCLAALHGYVNGRVNQISSGRGQYGRYNSRAAGERLVFDATRVGSYFHELTAQHTGKIRIRPAGLKKLMPADFPSLLCDRAPIESLHEAHGVGNARIDAV